MRPSLRLREYIEAAKLAQQRAHSEQNPYAKQILQEIERSYYRLVEVEKVDGGPATT
jgi:predicted outer membrane protein